MPAKKYEGDFAERKRQSTRAWMAKNATRGPGLWAAAQKARKQKDPVYVFFGLLKHRGTRQHASFDLTLEYVRELMAPMICSKTGQALSWDWDGPGSNPWAPSIDRIDSSHGYVMGNVQVVSWIYNRCKGEWPDEIVEQFRRGT